MIPKHIIAFKDVEIEREFEQIKPRLQAFILVAGGFMYFTYGITLVVTGLLRSGKGSVHNYGNGVDFRTKDLTEEQGDALIGFLKWKLPYYLKLPMPIKPKYSIRDEREEGGTGPHIHGQVNWREE